MKPSGPSDGISDLTTIDAVAENAGLIAEKLQVYMVSYQLLGLHALNT